MSESNYHLEALRKQRVIERKKDALEKLAKGHQDTCEQQGGVQQAKDTILFTGPGDYDYNRSSGLEQQIPNFKKDEGVVFDEVVHDPNFNYRILKETGHPPIHVDPIYKIMYPGAVIYKGENIRAEIAMKQENDAKAKSKNHKTNLSKRNVKKKQVPESIRKIQRDQVFKILHPSIYNWIGKERCRRQYDHSRNGPLLDSTWYSLKQELNTIGQCMPLSSGEGKALSYQDLLRIRVLTPKK